MPRAIKSSQAVFVEIVGTGADVGASSTGRFAISKTLKTVFWSTLSESSILGVGRVKVLSCSSNALMGWHASSSDATDGATALSDFNSTKFVGSTLDVVAGETCSKDGGSIIAKLVAFGTEAGAGSASFEVEGF